MSDLHIPHWSEGLRVSAEMTPPPAPQEDTPALANKSRVQLETEGWIAQHARFAALWRVRTTDVITDDHPMQDWVTRQRKLHKTAKLMAWKRQMLDAIGFPYVSSRAALTPTNLEYAAQLVAFYKEHGHYSPTITIGGAGLTLLKSQIAGFDFERIGKTEVNLACGLTANGYRHACLARWEVPWNPVMLRVIFAQRYPVDMQRCFQSVPVALMDICARAAFYEQALRVTVSLGAAKEVWGLRGVVGDTLSLSRPKEVNEQTDSDCTVTLTSIGVGRYNTDKGHFELPCRDVAGRSILLDYDYCLADRIHRFHHPMYLPNYVESVLLCENDCKLVDWAAWEDGSARPERFVGPQSTANVTFEKNLVKLAESVAAVRRVHGAACKPNITWAAWGLNYKFIEHEVLRARQGDIPPSHVERLIALNVTWGMARLGLRDVLAQYSRYSIEP